MRGGIDLRKGVGDDAVFINNVGDSAGIAGITGAIRLTQNIVGITE